VRLQWRQFQCDPKSYGARQSNSWIGLSYNPSSARRSTANSQDISAQIFPGSSERPVRIAALFALCIVGTLVLLHKAFTARNYDASTVGLLNDEYTVKTSQSSSKSYEVSYTFEVKGNQYKGKANFPSSGLERSRGPPPEGTVDSEQTRSDNDRGARWILNSDYCGLRTWSAEGAVH